LNGNFKSYFAGKPVPPVKEPDLSAAKDSLQKIALLTDTTAKNRTIVTENKGRHLVVVGESQFLTGQFAMQGNVTFLLNVVDWLSTDDNLISIRTRTMVDRTLSKDNLKEGSSLSNLIRYINIFLMPAIVIVIGLLIFFRRREKVSASVPTEKTEEKTK
jgi:ABC-type uncharacterized transport system involved in gliding motility auxiliary subunit